MSSLRVSRRDFGRLSAAGVLGASASGWFPAFAAEAAKNPQRKRSCILLWMNGGPATIDMFDVKAGHANGGPTKEIQTKAPGLKFSEYLPKLANHAEHNIAYGAHIGGFLCGLAVAILITSVYSTLARFDLR